MRVRTTLLDPCPQQASNPSSNITILVLSSSALTSFPPARPSLRFQSGPSLNSSPRLLRPFQLSDLTFTSTCLILPAMAKRTAPQSASVGPAFPPLGLVAGPGAPGASGPASLSSNHLASSYSNSAGGASSSDASHANGLPPAPNKVDINQAQQCRLQDAYWSDEEVSAVSRFHCPCGSSALRCAAQRIPAQSSPAPPLLPHIPWAGSDRFLSLPLLLLPPPPSYPFPSASRPCPPTKPRELQHLSAFSEPQSTSRRWQPAGQLVRLPTCTRPLLPPFISLPFSSAAPFCHLACSVGVRHFAARQFTRIGGLFAPFIPSPPQYSAHTRTHTLPTTVAFPGAIHCGLLRQRRAQPHDSPQYPWAQPISTLPGADALIRNSGASDSPLITAYVALLHFDNAHSCFRSANRTSPCHHRANHLPFSPYYHFSLLFQGGHGLPTLSRGDRSLRCQLQALSVWLSGKFPSTSISFVRHFADPQNLASLQICRFCWHHIKQNLNGRCPACRRKYSDQTVEFKPMTAEE